MSEPRKKLILPHMTRPLKFRCRVCGARFYEDEHRIYEGHVVGCAAKHEAELRSDSHRERLAPILGADVGDVEFKAWVKANRAALLDGRMKM